VVTSHGRIRGPQIYYVLWKDHTNLLVCGEETIKTILLQNFVKNIQVDACMIELFEHPISTFDAG
jgi:hypothetical protein